MTPPSALAPYRILDLTTRRAWLVGKLLADLGASVLKVEKPGGDADRLAAPFAGDIVDAEGSLAWWAHNRGKRSTRLDLSTPAGREAFLQLAGTADAILESFDPGTLEEWLLGFDVLSAANPRLVLTRITPFGQTGPYAPFAANDLILSALGGPSWLAGDEDRAPVRISEPQYFAHAAAEGALHTAVALYHARETGQGQQLDVSAQTATVRTLLNGYSCTYTDGAVPRRGTFGKPNSLFPIPTLFRCLDGYVLISIGFGAGLGAYIKWAQEENVVVPDFLANLTEEDLASSSQLFSSRGADFASNTTVFLSEFFAARTRKELLAGSLRRRIVFVGVNTLQDIRNDDQLAVRNYFQPVQHAGRAEPVAYPTVWAQLSETPIKSTSAAPGVEDRGDIWWRETAPQSPDGALSERRRVTNAVGGNHSRDVFAGLKVWDMSWVGVGPLTGRYLADYGATVVRTESFRSLDVLRNAPPFKDGRPGLNRSQIFADYNASKLDLGVNLASPAGREVALRLAAWADVVIESFAPGAVDRLGLAYGALREINPSIIMLSSSMNGQTGPRRNFAGFGTVLASMSGFAELTGWPDRPPNSPFGAYTDLIAQRFCGLAVVAALDHRKRTGVGQYIDLSQYEAALQFLAPALLDLEVNARRATRRGNRHPYSAPHGHYRCLDEAGLDRWVAIGVETEEQWRNLVALMGYPAWAEAPKFASMSERKENEDELDGLLGSWISDKTAKEVFERLQPTVPAAPVQTAADILVDPQLRHREYMVTLRHPEMGEMPYEGSQVIASETPPRPRKAGPCFGEDNIKVLRDFLGYSESEIEQLIESKAIESEQRH